MAKSKMGEKAIRLLVGAWLAAALCAWSLPAWGGETLKGIKARVLGSWIFASGLLMLGWMLKGQG
jgi:hypothetical protein